MNRESVVKIRNSRNQLNEKIKELETLNLQQPNIKFLQNLQQAYLNLRYNVRKTAIAFVGPSDSGKSTLINTLLGENILPAEYSPTTSTVIRIVHEQDKPNWLKGDTLVIGGTEEAVLMFTLAELTNAKNSMIVAQGNRDLITKYGKRGQSSSTSIAENILIYTFVKSDLLQYCELWDTPGTSAGIDDQSAKEENLSEKMRLQANIVVVTSVIVQFLHSNVLDYLVPIFNKYHSRKNKVKDSDELYELFILATMADFIPSSEEHNRLIEMGWEKIKLIKEKEEELRKDSMNWLTYEWYRDHCLAYSSFKADYVDTFKNSLLPYLYDEEERKFQLIEEDIREIWYSCLREYNENFEELSDELEENTDIQHEVDQMKKNRSKVIEIHEQSKNELLKQLPSIVEKTIDEVSKYYDRLMREDNLIDLMDIEGTANNDDSKAKFTEKLVKRLESVVEEEVDLMKEALSDQYGEQLQEMQRLTGIMIQSFNYEAETAAILASGVVGSAFLWVAATTASNLGLYILVAQVGGILTSLGIITSPIWLTTLVAATGGPIAWAIGLTALVGLGFAALFGNWKKSFAEQLIAGFNEKNVRYEIINNFNKFAIDYAKDVTVYFDNLNTAYDRKISNLEKKKKRTKNEIIQDMNTIKKLAKQLGIDNYYESLVI